MKKKNYNGKALDLIQTIYMEQYTPIVYCYVTFSSFIDLARLKSAVSCTAVIVPQILCRYDYQKNRWCPAGHDVDSIIKVFSENDHCDNIIWNLQVGPQLKINIYHQSDSDSLQICMSHILADGAGLLQYLALLCRFYNKHDSVASEEVNHRSIVPLLYHTASQRIRRSHSPLHKGDTPALLPKESTNQLPVSLKVTLSAIQMATIKKKANSLDVTLNDVFMAAYIHTLKDYILCEEIAIPCPADLRKYDRQNNKLTIANMTGKYLCRVPLVRENGIAKTALVIHKKMERLKDEYTCFKLMSLLQILHSILPKRIVRLIIKRCYSIEPTSYSNLGVIDEHKIFFQGAAITECCLCGAYRPAPSFQVSISTYGNVCTISANMLGSENQKNAGMLLLEKMKSSLLAGFLT
ncbi:MAG: hypothetical protein K6T85_17590 [Gorillibacterium sp.]|nr:hypothetical protein [Gorillibacterium sp.]